jgi:lysophospholipase L1-like esterase
MNNEWFSFKKKKKKKMSESQQTIRILAFGDSLTEGYSATTRGGLIFHPYTLELKHLLQSKFPSMRIEIVNAGVSGEMAVAMPKRLAATLKQFKDYDLAIFLGGTNDIGQAAFGLRNKSADDVGNETGAAIAVAMETMVAAVSANGTDAICMSTPVHGGETVGEKLKFGHSKIARSVLRDRLIALAAKDASTTTSFFDLGEAIPYGVPDAPFCDYLHFTPKGYDLMGAKLFEVAVPILEKRLEKRAAAGAGAASTAQTESQN